MIAIFGVVARGSRPNTAVQKLTKSRCLSSSEISGDSRQWIFQHSHMHNGTLKPDWESETKPQLFWNPPQLKNEGKVCKRAAIFLKRPSFNFHLASFSFPILLTHLTSVTQYPQPKRKKKRNRSWCGVWEFITHSKKIKMGCWHSNDLKKYARKRKLQLCCWQWRK
jgi:hypothetical protein